MSEDAGKPSEKIRVLFTCTGNTCRSVMAEFIAREKFGEILDPSSAGFRPQRAEDAENAIYTLKSFLNIDASGHQPRDIRKVDVNSYSFVITMDSWVTKQFVKEFPNYPVNHLIKWKIDDPWGDNLEDYRRCAQAIFKEMKKLSIINEATA